MFYLVKPPLHFQRKRSRRKSDAKSSLPGMMTLLLLVTLFAATPSMAQNDTLSSSTPSSTSTTSTTTMTTTTSDDGGMLEDASAEKLVYAHAEELTGVEEGEELLLAAGSARSRSGTNAEPRQLMNFRAPIRNLRQPLAPARGKTTAPNGHGGPPRNGQTSSASASRPYGLPPPAFQNDWESRKTAALGPDIGARDIYEQNRGQYQDRVRDRNYEGYRSTETDRPATRDKTYFPVPPRVKFPEPSFDSWTPKPLGPFTPPTPVETAEPPPYRRPSTRVTNKNSNSRINYQQEYFSQPAVRSSSTTFRPTRRTTSKPKSKIPVIVKKRAKRPKRKQENIRGVEGPTRRSVSLNRTDLCALNQLNCDDKNTTKLNGSFGQPLLDFLRGEVWVIPILVASIALVIVLIIFEIYLISKSISANPSRRHLFLGQMLMLGLVLCCGMAIVSSLKPTPVICSVLRIGIGVSYTVIYSTLLVKLVFLISLNSGVYLPATYQCLLLCFAILIQMVIGIQWLVSAPADAVELTILETGAVYQTCNVTFQQQLLGLLYVMFLVLVVVILAFKSRGVRENYREAMYIGLTMHFTVCIFIVWILAGFFAPAQFQDVCVTCGLVGCAAITFVIMFMPKGRQLSAMGKEGVYAEDRPDVYTGSSTQSTGSGGTPSPSFFPIKPGKLVQQFREKEFQTQNGPAMHVHHREPMQTPPGARKQENAADSSDQIYSSLESVSEDGVIIRPQQHSPTSSNSNTTETNTSSDSSAPRLPPHNHHPMCPSRLSGLSSAQSTVPGNVKARAFMINSRPPGLPGMQLHSSYQKQGGGGKAEAETKQSATNPNVVFRRPAADLATGILY